MLPTVWDAWSARAVVDAGFPALSVGSHQLADSRGQRDKGAAGAIGITIEDTVHNQPRYSVDGGILPRVDAT